MADLAGLVAKGTAIGARVLELIADELPPPVTPRSR
jgi:hypothetical protein